MKINSYRDLEVGQCARKLAKDAYLLTKLFSKDELFGMISQIRRAATSIAANIAEGWGRRYPNEFNQFLRIANGSLKELETHLIISTDVGLCQETQTKPLLEECEILGKQLLSLQRSIKSK